MSFLDFSAYDFDTWLSFIKEKWLIIALVLVVILVVMKIVKTVVKWVLVILLVLGLIFYSGYSLEDVKNFSGDVMSSSLEGLKDIGSKVTDTVKQEAINIMLDEATDATYTANADGTYTIVTNSIELTGELGQDEVSISVKGAPAFKVQVNETITNFVEKAKEKS